MSGFDGKATTMRIGTQMVGTVLFFDENTLDSLFEIQIPDGALAIFAIIGLNNEYSDDGFVYTFDELASLLNDSLLFVQIITNLDDDIANSFVLSSISSFHPSTGNTLA